MAQKTVYICDSCRKIIGEKIHISMNLHQSSGVAIPPKTLENKTPNWSLRGVQGFRHFCNVKCLTTFIDKEIKAVSFKKPKW